MQKTRKAEKSKTGITKLTVSGFKSIGSSQSISIKPLTILAGANSSGKSSIIQPILLLKQTMEENFDPGALLLNGPNVKFTSAEQLLTVKEKRKTKQFTVEIEEDDKRTTTLNFRRVRTGFEISSMIFRPNRKSKFQFTLNMDNKTIVDEIKDLDHPFKMIVRNKEYHDVFRFRTIRDRCFIDVTFGVLTQDSDSSTRVLPLVQTKKHIRNIIHLPGLRGNPERNYPVTAVGQFFPGTFEKYVASIISNWVFEKNNEKLDALSADLCSLGLTWRVTAKAISDAQLEIYVDRLVQPRTKKNDLVSIADVGLGVSQTLPVLVALHVAEEGQIVYLEQPEIHLHPRAQLALADILAKAANRGVKVIVETHSSLLIRGVQTLVAEGSISDEIIALHWVKRSQETGLSEIVSAKLDENGSYGEWPEDFDEISLRAEGRYLDAVEKKIFNQ